MHALKLLPTVYMAAVTPASSVPMSAPAPSTPTSPAENVTASSGSAQPSAPRQR